jgi:NhaP-type Na+/H+ or K+/H+ antiporter
MNPKDTIESSLKSYLHPVHPDPFFVTSLRTKLNTPNLTVLEAHKSQNALWIILTGMAVGLLLVWLIDWIRRSLK